MRQTPKIHITVANGNMMKNSQLPTPIIKLLLVWLHQ